MSSAPCRDREVMSVSIAAGPAVKSFFEAVAAGRKDLRTALLSSSITDAPSGLTVFALPPQAAPDQIVSQVRVLAAKRTIDHLIIECERDRPPMAYASLFAANKAAPTLKDVAELTTTVFAIEAAAFVNAILGHRSNVLPACFVAEQIEFVSHIFLVAGSTDHDSNLASSIVLSLNPRARVFPLTPAAVEQWPYISGVPLDFDAALNGGGWRHLLDTEKPNLGSDERITPFAYHARRPFHPERFWNLLQHDWPGVFRAKGFFWLASRMDEVGGLNLAGKEIHCASAGSWWAARDEESRDSGMPDRTRAEWQEPFGDRRQSFAIMALEVERAILESALDACLLTDAEIAEGPDSWKKFSDPFPSWSSHGPHTHDHDHDCEHDHDPEGHDCCHH
jgi:G3E family GTPase